MGPCMICLRKPTKPNCPNPRWRSPIRRRVERRSARPTSTRSPSANSSENGGSSASSARRRVWRGRGRRRRRQRRRRRALVCGHARLEGGGEDGGLAARGGARGEARRGLDAANERRFEDEGGAAVVVEQVSTSASLSCRSPRRARTAAHFRGGAWERRRLCRDERLLNVLDRRRAAAAAVGERGREGARLLRRPRLVTSRRSVTPRAAHEASSAPTLAPSSHASPPPTLSFSVRSRGGAAAPPLARPVRAAG